MHTRIYFLFALFLLIVVQSTSLDVSNQKTRKTYDNDDTDSNDNYGYDKTVNDRGNDEYSQVSSYRRDRNRYSPYSLSDNYRSRSRWSPSPSSSYDDRYDLSEYSPSSGYGPNSLISSLAGGLPPSAFDTGAYLGAGPSCYSLLDPQYPLFSDICGAVPQARYSLPNAFGHIERWQIAQTLTAILNPATTNPACTRSLRLLLCPLLFPPCPTRFEAPPVLPCQPYCRMVKSQCANPALELLPCDFLPPTSDLCPINPAPYSSLSASYAQPLPFPGPLPPPGALLPQSPLSAILSQSALQSGLSPMDLPPGLSSLLSPGSPYASMLAQSALQSGLSPMDLPPPGLSSLLSPGSPYASMLAQSAFHPGLSPMDLPPPGFSSLLSSRSPFSSMLPPSPYPSPLGSPGGPPSPLLSPFNSLLNMESGSLADTLKPILVDFPPLRYAEAASRYFPSLRSANEKV